MRINNVVSEVMKVYLQKGERDKPASPEGVDRPASPDEVELSPAARDIAAVQQALARLSAVRQERVEELRRKIQSGQYQPDAKRLAEKMVEAIRAAREQ